MPPKPIPVDWDSLCAHLEARGTMTDWCNQNGVKPNTVQKRISSDPALRARVAAARQGVRAALQRGVDTSSGAPEIDASRLRHLSEGEIAVLADENGVDLSKWAISSATINKWGQPGDESRQVKVRMRPRTWPDDLRPAASPPPLKLGKPRKARKGEATLIVAHSDDHAPYHEQPLHEAFCRFLGDVEPHRVLHLGDLLDLPTISRHRDDPSHAAPPQECIDAGYQLLRERRQMSPASEWGFIPGNHDDRLRTELLARAERMFGVRPAPTDDDPDPIAALSLRRLLHLDGLGIRLHDAPDDGDYHHGEVRHGDSVAFRHGWLTGRDPAGRTMETLGMDAVVGHTHHQRMSYATRRFRGMESVMVGVEAGCMCRTDPGYMPRGTHNWQQGFATVTVWPDGSAQYEHARWIDGALRWRGQSWRP